MTNVMVEGICPKQNNESAMKGILVGERQREDDGL